MRIAQIAPLMESIPPQTLWRLGAGRLLSHRGAGGPGPRRDAVRQRAVDHVGQAGAVLRAAAAAQPRRARHHPLLHADARQGAQHGVRVRHPALPHRPVPFPDLQRDGAAHGDDAARSPGPAGPAAALSRLSRACRWCRSRTRSGRRSPTPTSSATVYHGLPRDLLRRRSNPRGGYLAFLGRISPEKRVDRAIADRARASACRSRSPPRSIASTRPISAPRSSRCWPSPASSTSARSTSAARRSSWARRARCCSRSTGRSRSASS